MPRRMYAGNAPATTLSGAINSTTSTIVVADASGYPDGSAGNFWIVIDRGLSTEEKVLCNDTTGNTITAVDRTNSANRDDTSNFSHSNAAPVEHCYTADDADDANAHTYDVARDNHTQYHNTTRHAAVSHTTAMIGDGQVTLAKLASEAWTSYTPVLRQGTTTFTLAVEHARYQRVGRLITAVGVVTITAGTGQAANALTISLPVNGVMPAVGVDLPVGQVGITDTSTAERALGMLFISATDRAAVLDAFLSTTPVTPFDLADTRTINDEVRWLLTYEAAS